MELPPGWVEGRSKSRPGKGGEGRVYYFNKKTGQSSWKFPRGNENNDEKENRQNRQDVNTSMVPDCIIPGLYLGCYECAANKDYLKSVGVQSILNMAAVHCKNRYPGEFDYRDIYLHDEEDRDISRFFEEAFAFIDGGLQKGAVLVHCYAGRSRSVSIVLFYLMRKHGWELDRALAHVKSERKVAKPNPGFVAQLLEIEFASLGRKSIDIRAYKRQLALEKAERAEREAALQGKQEEEAAEPAPMEG